MHETENVYFLVADIFLMISIILLNVYSSCVFIFKSKLRNTKTRLLLSLSIADLGIGIFVIPNVISIQFGHIQWADIVCKLCLTTEALTGAASSIVISVMAVDRLFAIVFPLKMRAVKPLYPYLVIALIWILATLYSLRAPFIFGVFENVQTIGNTTVIKHSCTVDDTKKDIHDALIIVDFVIMFLLPSVVLVSCNIAVSIRLSQTTVTQNNIKSTTMKRLRAIRLLMVMVAIFVCCHLPLQTFRLHVYRMDGDVPYKKYISQSFMLIYFLNSILNVLFYGALSEDVKQVTKALCCIVCRHKSSTKVGTTSSDCPTPGQSSTRVTRLQL